jgi:hypothetical protein
MKKNNFNPEKKVPLWQKAVGYLNILMLIGQVSLPSLAHAFVLFDEAQAAQELNNSSAFQRVYNTDSQFIKSEYIVELPASTQVQTIETFYKKLIDHKKYGLQAPQYIPILNDGITIIFPHYELKKRVGDRFVQSRMIRSQIYASLNRTLISDSYTSEAQQINALYNNAYDFAGTTNTKFGDKVTASQVSTFNKNFIWPELRTINGESVLVPVVQLTQATIDKLSINGHVAEFGGSVAEFNSVKINSGTLKTQRDTFIKTAENLTVNPSAEIRADGDLNLFVGGTLQNLSGRLSANQNVDIIAGQYQQKTVVHRYATRYEQGTRLGEIASVDANGNIRIRSYGDIVVEGGAISGNTIGLKADGNIILKSQQTSYVNNQPVGGYDSEVSEVEHLTTKLSAQDSIFLMASGAIELNAAELYADQGVIEILAANGVYVANAFNQFQSQRYKKWGRTTEQEQEFETIAIRAALEAGRGVMIATEFGDITLQAADIKSGTGTEINARNGRVNLLLAKEQDHYFYNKVKKGFWKIKTETIRDTTDTAVYNEIIGGVKVQATQGITLELGQYDGESVTDVINEFSKSESLSWMADIYNDPQYKCPTPALPQAPEGYADYAYQAMQNDPAFYQCTSMLDVVYSKLEDIHKHDKTSSLSPAAMAIIAIAMSVALGPGAGLIGQGSVISTTFGTGTLGAAMSAGTLTLATHAATSLANGNDIEETLKSMHRSDTIKAVALSMATAGTLSGVEGLEFFGEVNPNAATLSVDTLISVGNQTTQVIVNSAVSAGIETIINGKSLDTLGDSFVAALRYKAVNTIGSNLTGSIESSNFSEAMKYIAHAATGCLLATVQSTVGNNSEECIAGAAGATSAKFVASLYDPKVDALTAQGEKAAEWLDKHVGIDINKLSEDELNYYLNTLDISPAELSQWNSMKQAIRELTVIQSEGADIARLIAGLTAFVANGTAAVINSTAENAQNITQGAAFRAMSPEYQRATVLLAVLEHNYMLQAASLKLYTVKELLQEGVRLPSAFDNIALEDRQITGEEAALLHDIAIMEVLTSGTPAEKASLIEEYGDAISEYSNLDNQILSFDWKGFGRDAGERGPVAVFREMMLHFKASRMDDVQGIETIREIFDSKWEKYIDRIPLFEALGDFGAAQLANKFAGKVLISTLKSSSRTGFVRSFIVNEKKHFVQELIDEAQYLLKYGDGNTPLVHNRVAISKAFIAGKASSKTDAFFNFTGKPARVPNIINDGTNGISYGSSMDTLIITDPESYMSFLKNFYNEKLEVLDPRLITEIKSYLDFAYKHEIQIPHGRAGAPGLHAEVRAVNKILKENPTVSFSDISIATVRLKGDDAGTNFPACTNCSGILQKFEILTGRVD